MAQWFAVEEGVERCDDPRTLKGLTEGRQIAIRRDLLGWTQDDLAEAAQISKSTVLRIEKDSGGSPAARTAALVAIEKEERARGGGPTLSTHSGTTEPSLKEGADGPASARLADIRKRLANIQTALTALTHQLGLIGAELDNETGGAGDQKRKQG
jgi:transcriptional regulator with XRE-family HTH domain